MKSALLEAMLSAPDLLEWNCKAQRALGRERK
jgi:hypothetical protein